MSSATVNAGVRATTTQALTLLGLLGLLWGSSYALGAIALQSLPPITVVAIRIGFAIPIMLLVITWQGARLPRDGATWRSYLVQGSVNPAVPWMLIAWGQQYVGSGLTGVINTLSPVIAVMVVAFWTRHEVITRAKLGGVLVGLLGVLVILGSSALSGHRDELIAELAILTGTACFASAAIFGRRFNHIAPAVSATCTLLTAGATVIPLALVVEAPWSLAPSKASLAACLVLAVFCTALGFLAYFRLIQMIGSTGTTSVSYVRVGVAVMLGVIALGEPFTPKLGLGLICIVAAVVLIARSATVSEPQRPTG